MNNSIVLVDCIFNKLKVSEPVGISILASVLRAQGFTNVSVYDPCVNGDSLQTALEKILAANPEVVGLSITQMNDVSIKDCAEISSMLKQRIPQCTIIVGGHGPSLNPDKFLPETVDAVFIGESEVSLPDFLSRIIKGEKYDDVQGIAYRDASGAINITPPPARIDDLNSLPFPARDVLVDLKNKYGSNIVAQIIGSRGCYMNCGYCSVKAFTRLQEGKVYRERSVESIIGEMKYLHEEFNIRRFVFEDDNFIPRNPAKAREKVNEFCQKIRILNIPELKFYIQFRPDNMHTDLVEKLKEIGLRGIFTGVESINQQDLELFGRLNDIDKTIEALNSLNRVGFSCDINSKYRLKIGYIMFNPYSTRQTLENSCHFLLRYKVTPKKLLTTIIPYENTPIRERLKNEGLIDDNGVMKFRDPDATSIHRIVQRTINYILDFRERVRMPAKMSHELGSSSFMDDLESIRSALDNLCFEAFLETVKSPTEALGAIEEKYMKMVDKYRDDPKLSDLLRDVEEKYEINHEAKNLFR